MDCVFCSIAAGEIPASKIFEDDQCLAFADIHPQAPVHFLVIPRKHIQSLAHAANHHASLLGHLLGTAAFLAKDRGLGDGYRVVINIGPQGGQTVDHLHVHVLGGRAMQWPPG